MTRPILIVDDNPDDRELLELALRDAGVVARIAAIDDGAAAMAYLAELAEAGREGLPTLLLLDLKLPRKNGFEVLAWLREQPRLRHLPVVILSSSDDETDIRRAHELGTNAYMCKPTRFSDYRRVAAELSARWLSGEPIAG